MKYLIKNGFLGLFLLFSTLLVAQKPNAPVALSASYKRYNDRIELAWTPTTPAPLYRIFRKQQGKNGFELLDSVSQGRHIDRKDLRYNRNYLYHIRAVSANGLMSDASNEAMGALLPIASERDTSHVPTPKPQDCIKIEGIKIHVSAKDFALTFLAKAKCMAELTLFRSDDAVLDAQDNFLSQQKFEATRPRGALTAKNNGEKTTGYLLLKVEVNGEYFVIAQEIGK